MMMKWNDDLITAFRGQSSLHSVYTFSFWTVNGEVIYWWRRWECFRCLKPGERTYDSQNEGEWKKTKAEGGQQDTHSYCDGVMDFSSFIGRELSHKRCPGSSPVPCRKELRSNESRTGVLEHHKVGQHVLEGPKDETKSTKYKEIPENTLTQTERRTCLC